MSTLYILLCLTPENVTRNGQGVDGLNARPDPTRSRSYVSWQQQRFGCLVGKIFAIFAQWTFVLVPIFVEEMSNCTCNCQRCLKSGAIGKRAGKRLKRHRSTREVGSANRHAQLS